MTDNNQSIIEEAKAAAESAAEYTKAFEAEFAKQTKIEPEKSTAAVTGKYTLDYALEQLERVREESSAFAIETMQKIGEIKSGGPEDIGAQAAGNALRTLIEGQEQVYRRMLDFYTKIIYDLSPTLSIRACDER